MTTKIDMTKKQEDIMKVFQKKLSLRDRIRFLNLSVDLASSCCQECKLKGTECIQQGNPEKINEIISNCQTCSDKKNKVQLILNKIDKIYKKVEG